MQSLSTTSYLPIRRTVQRPLGKPDPPVVLTALKERLLFALSRFHYLTIDQVVRFFGLRPSSTSWIRGKLRELVAHEFVETQFLPRTTPSGRLPLIYALGTKGIKHCKQLGLSVSYRSPRERIRSYLFLTHTLQLNDFLIAACLLPKAVPEIVLHDWHHDLTLKHQPVRMNLGKSKQVLLVPDSWLDWQLLPPFGMLGADRFSAFLELDRNTEDIRQFKRKIRSYVAFANGPYKAFGSECFTVLLCIATGGHHRLHQLRKWTIETLTEDNVLDYAVFFQFALLPPSSLPSSLFLSPVWYALENDVPVPLFAPLL